MKMRWKLLLLLSLISISFVLATSEEEDVESVDIVKSDNNEENLNVAHEDEKVNEEETEKQRKTHTRVQDEISKHYTKNKQTSESNLKISSYKCIMHINI